MFINAALFRDLTTILPTRGTQLAVLNNKSSNAEDQRQM